MTACSSDFLSALILIFLFQMSPPIKPFAISPCAVGSKAGIGTGLSVTQRKELFDGVSVCNSSDLQSGPGDVLPVLFATGDGEM